jgi:hypothetical protein
MALYVPDGARRRRLAIAVAVGLAAGLLLGFVLGRSTADGLDDGVASVQEQAAEAATALERIPIEYEQALAGEGGESTTTITDAVDRASAQLDEAYEAAIWLGSDARDGTDAAFAEIEAEVAAGADLVVVQDAIDAGVAEIQLTFALSP